jgi:hypothetical protein
MNATDPASSGGELLYGTRKIADFLGMRQRQIYHLQARGALPTFRVGQTVCARPATLLKWLSEQEAASVRGD